MSRRWAPAALANAVFDACGVRLRTVPFTRERVKAAIAALAGEARRSAWGAAVAGAPGQVYSGLIGGPGKASGPQP